MLKKLFGLGDSRKKPAEEVIFSPADGAVMDLASVPDPVFSQKNDGGRDRRRACKRRHCFTG